MGLVGKQNVNNSSDDLNNYLQEDKNEVHDIYNEKSGL